MLSWLEAEKVNSRHNLRAVSALVDLKIQAHTKGDIVMKRNLMMLVAAVFMVTFAVTSFPRDAFAGETFSRYTIKWGDMLKKIAVKHYGKGKERKLFLIAKVNGIKNPDRIFAGRTILIPKKRVAAKIVSKKEAVAQKAAPASLPVVKEIAAEKSEVKAESAVKEVSAAPIKSSSAPAIPTPATAPTEVQKPVETVAVQTLSQPAVKSEVVEKPAVAEQTKIPVLIKESKGGECGEIVVLMWSPRYITAKIPGLSCGKKKLLESIWTLNLKKI